MNNIVLAGFMGTGKTSVGKALAKKLGMSFVDLDDVIEERQKKKISDIFAQDGEAFFRQAEKEAVRDYSKKESMVIATGGGAIVDPENLTMLKAGGVVILLEAGIETIIERTSGEGHRPLLLVDDPKSKIEGLLASRMEAYRKADYRVDTTPLSVEKVVEKIIEIMNMIS